MLIIISYFVFLFAALISALVSSIGSNKIQLI
uniref:Cytochrome b6-f complex subunit 6 n=1 Tax=Leucobryum juniperoideum TaxID=80889 RepID=A0A5P8HA12_9BRYO|nr:cytochrome b6/f complex subunit VI [Leucobryum juniperoideum]